MYANSPYREIRALHDDEFIRVYQASSLRDLQNTGAQIARHGSSQVRYGWLIGVGGQQ